MSFGEIWIRLNRARERVSRIGILFQLDENEPNAVPGDGMLGGCVQHLPIRFECQLGVFPFE